jgi:hypothetical protein
MQKIKTTIKEIREKAIMLGTNGDVLEIPNKFINKPKVGETVVVTFATEKEDAMSAKEVAHELIKTALRGE